MKRGHRVFQFLRYSLLAVSVSLLMYIIVRVGTDKIVSHLTNIHLGWTTLAMMCIAANFFFATLRYRLLLASDMNFKDLLEIVMASYLLNYASLIQGLGLGVKIGMLKARDIPISHSSAGIWLEVYLDILFCITVTGMGLLVINDLVFENPTLLLIPPMLFIGGTFVITKANRFYNRWLNLENFISAIKNVASSSRLASSLFCTAGIWIAAGTGYHCMLKAMLDSSGADLGLSLLALTSGFLTGLISMVPGGLGVRELTWSYIVSQNGYPVEIAGLSAIIYRLFSILLVLLFFVAKTYLYRNRN